MNKGGATRSKLSLKHKRPDTNKNSARTGGPALKKPLVAPKLKRDVVVKLSMCKGLRSDKTEITVGGTNAKDASPCSSREGNTDGCDRAEGMDKATCSSTVSNSDGHSSRDGGPCSSRGGNTDHFDPGERVSNLNDAETGMGELFFCHICQKDLTHFDLTRRQQHVNRCCDTAAESEGGDEVKADSGSGQFVCVVCRKSFGNEQGKTVHMKSCAKKKGLSTPELLNLVKGGQKEVPEIPKTKRQTDLKAILGNSDKDFKEPPHSVAPRRKRSRGRKKDEVVLEEARLYQDIADDQLQLALALSASLGEEGEVCGTGHGPGEVSTVRETKSKARGRKRPKLQKETPPLLTVSTQQAHDIIASRAEQLLRPPATGGGAEQEGEGEDEEIPCTPAFGSSKLAGGECPSATLLAPAKRSLDHREVLVGVAKESCDQPGNVDEDALLWEQEVQGSEQTSEKCEVEIGHNSGASEAPEHEASDVLHQVSFAKELQDVEYPTLWGLGASELAFDRLGDFYVPALAPAIVPSEHNPLCCKRCNSEVCVINLGLSQPSCSEVTKPHSFPSVARPEQQSRNEGKISTLLADLASLIDSPLLSDLTILTKGGTQIMAHGCILAARCPGFREALLGCPLSSPQVLDLSDFSRESVLAYLRDVYSATADSALLDEGEWEELQLISNRMSSSEKLSPCIKLRGANIEKNYPASLPLQPPAASPPGTSTLLTSGGDERTPATASSSPLLSAPSPPCTRTLPCSRTNAGNSSSEMTIASTANSSSTPLPLCTGPGDSKNVSTSCLNASHDVTADISSSPSIPLHTRASTDLDSSCGIANPDTIADVSLPSASPPLVANPSTSSGTDEGNNRSPDSCALVRVSPARASLEQDCLVETMSTRSHSPILHLYSSPEGDETSLVEDLKVPEQDCDSPNSHSYSSPEVASSSSVVEVSPAPAAQDQDGDVRTLCSKEHSTISHSCSSPEAVSCSLSPALDLASPELPQSHTSPGDIELTEVFDDPSSPVLFAEDGSPCGSPECCTRLSSSESERDTGLLTQQNLLVSPDRVENGWTIVGDLLSRLEKSDNDDRDSDTSDPVLVDDLFTAQQYLSDDRDSDTNDQVLVGDSFARRDLLLDSDPMDDHNSDTSDLCVVDEPSTICEQAASPSEQQDVAEYLTSPSSQQGVGSAYEEDLTLVFEDFVEVTSPPPPLPTLPWSKLSPTAPPVQAKSTSPTPHPCSCPTPHTNSDLSFAPPGTQHVRLETAFATPAATSGVLLSDDNITPTPKYDRMHTPQLKEQCARYGVRVLPKRKMIAKLKEIYDYTHPLVAEDGRIVTEEEQRELVKQKEVVTKDKPSNGKTKSQDSDRIQQVKTAITSDQQLYQDILLYKPLEIGFIQARLKSAGLSLSREKLADMLDFMCITFIEPRNRNSRK